MSICPLLLDITVQVPGAVGLWSVIKNYVYVYMSSAVGLYKQVPGAVGSISVIDTYVYMSSADGLYVQVSGALGRYVKLL